MWCSGQQWQIRDMMACWNGFDQDVGQGAEIYILFLLVWQYIHVIIIIRDTCEFQDGGQPYLKELLVHFHKRGYLHCHY
jgi:hypothetical protein